MLTANFGWTFDKRDLKEEYTWYELISQETYEYVVLYLNGKLLLEIWWPCSWWYKS